jgi:hypothetical protein
MFLKQARATPLSEAVQKTFDGAHPCQLCKGIAHAQGRASKTPVPVELGKIPLLRASAERFTVEPRASFATSPCAPFVPLRSDGPESPPPRVSPA